MGPKRCLSGGFITSKPGLSVDVYYQTLPNKDYLWMYTNQTLPNQAYHSQPAKVNTDVRICSSRHVYKHHSPLALSDFHICLRFKKWLSSQWFEKRERGIENGNTQMAEFPGSVSLWHGIKRLFLDPFFMTNQPLDATHASNKAIMAPKAKDFFFLWVKFYY